MIVPKPGYLIRARSRIGLVVEHCRFAPACTVDHNITGNRKRWLEPLVEVPYRSIKRIVVAPTEILRSLSVTPVTMPTLGIIRLVPSDPGDAPEIRPCAKCVAPTPYRLMVAGSNGAVWSRPCCARAKCYRALTDEFARRYKRENQGKTVR